jgi:hypothetical protein
VFDEFTHSGLWFLPDSPDVKVHGTLQFSPTDGATLTLGGTLGSPRVRRGTQQFEIILGVSDAGKLLTLHRCIRTRLTTTVIPDGPSKTAYYAHFVFVGAHFPDSDHLRFTRCGVRFSNLHTWGALSGLSATQHRKPYGITLRYRRPEPIKIAQLDDVELHLEARFSLDGVGFLADETTLTQDTHFRISTTKSFSLSELLEFVRRLQDFLTIAMAEPTYPLGIDLVVGPPTAIVTLSYELPRVPSKTKNIIPSDMLFRFDDVRDTIDGKLTRWFGQAELLAPVYALYFGTLYNPLAYQEQRFLAFAQALETYHRTTMNHPAMAKSEFRKLRDAMLEPLSPEQREWALKKTGHMNHLTLADRLNEIWAKFEPVGRLFPVDKEEFIAQVVATRNYYTHYDSKAKSRAAVGEGLFALTQRLRVLLSTCLLYELGFSASEIARLISRNDTYQFDLGRRRPH